MPKSEKAKAKPKPATTKASAVAKAKKPATSKAAVKAAAKVVARDVAKAVGKKAAKPKAAPKAATKKKFDDGGRLVNVKVWPNEKKIIIAKAKKYTGGNVSSWLRFAALKCVPSATEAKRLAEGEY